MTPRIDTQQNLSEQQGRKSRTSVPKPYFLYRFVQNIGEYLGDVSHSFLSAYRQKNGLMVVIIALSCYAILPFVLGSISGSDAHQGWGWLGIQIMQPAFSDAYNITSAIESRQQGFDPLALNPADVTGRPMNYPRLWLQLGSLGIGQQQTALLAVLFILLFAIALGWMMRHSSLREGIVYAVVLCSPAVMLAIERGNNDLLIATMLIVAAFLPTGEKEKEGWVAGIPRYMLLLIASLLKLFPVAALVILFNTTKKRRLLALGICFFLFALYVAYTIGDIRQIGKVVPAAISTSFGSMVLPDYILKKAVKFGVYIPHIMARFLSLVACIVLPLWVLRHNVGNIIQATTTSEPLESKWQGRLWLTGSAVFCTAFLLGNNYDYRLLFLLLLLPQLFLWVKDERRKGVGLVLVLVLLLLWLTFNISSNYVVLKDSVNILSEVVAWALYSLLAGSLLHSFQPLQALMSVFARNKQGVAINAQ